MGAAMFGSVPAPAAAVPAVDVVEAVDENHFFDFESQRVQQLTLEQLKRTVKENDGRDANPLHGIYHYALIDSIVEMCEKKGLQAEIYDMFATNNRDKQTPGVSLYPQLEERYGIRAVEAHSIRRLYTNIRVRNFDTGELTTNLAVSYTQKGIQIGIGRNVKICHNQCMLGGDRYISDFTMHDRKGERISPADMLKRVDYWLSHLEELIMRDDEMIEKMKATRLTPQQILLIIGMLTAARVQNDTAIKAIRTNTVYPLNQAQICKFTEQLLVEQHEKGVITAWAMYNAATDLYKPQTAEQTMILPQNLAFVDFMRANGVI